MLDFEQRDSYLEHFSIEALNHYSVTYVVLTMKYMGVGQSV